MNEGSGRQGLFQKKGILDLPDLDMPEFDNEDGEQEKQMPEIQYLVDSIENETEQLVPIISNSMRTDWILDYEFNQKIGARSDQTDIETPELSYIEQQIAQLWASKFKDGYPFGIPPLPDSVDSVLEAYPDSSARSDDRLLSALIELAHGHETANYALRRAAEHNHLARVAQYRQIIPEDDTLDPTMVDISPLANSQYLEFLKRILYGIARNDPHIPAALLKELGSLVNQYSFSDLAQEVGYPRFNAEYPDLLRKMAKLPLPIYITTSYFDFLERLLQAEGKQPQTQICFYRNEPTNILAEHRIRDITPSISKPVVFHLYGYERYPSSLVLSEADYLDFLTEMASDFNSRAPKIPLYIREALSESALLILGYRILSWDFRILFRTLLNRKGQKLRKYKVALQLDPKYEEAFLDNDKALKYIEQYFKKEGFKLAVGNTVDFVNALWNEWERRNL